jgi:hypothetical protein
MDITLYEFNALNDFDKGEVLFKHGEHLTERFDEVYGYSLYQLNNFYVEVQYNGSLNAITKLTSFSTYTKLEPYLDKIDISEVTDKKLNH